MKYAAAVPSSQLLPTNQQQRSMKQQNFQTNTTTAKSQAMTGEGQQWLGVLKVPRLLLKKILG